MKFLGAISFIFFLLLSCQSPSPEQQPGAKQITTDTILQNGKQLFTAKCASCHMINKEMTGPALKGVQDRWPDKKKLYAFIRNSQAVINEDKYAHDLWLEFNQTVMPEHKDLNDAHISSILHYIKSVSENAKP